AGWQEAFVTGAGVLELVEIRHGGRTVTLENAEVTSLSGRVARAQDGVEIALRAVLSAGDELVSGRVEAAMTGGLVMVVDAILAAAPAQAPRRPEAPRPAPVERPSASAVKPPSQPFGGRPVAPIARPVAINDDDD